MPRDREADQRADETVIHELAGRRGPEFVLADPDGRWRPGCFATFATAETAARLPDVVLARLQRRADARRRGGTISAADLADLAEADPQESLKESVRRPRPARRSRSTSQGQDAA